MSNELREMKFISDEELITNHTGKHEIRFRKEPLSEGWVDKCLCTVGELIQMLSKYELDDLLQIQGSDDTNSDYSPRDDSRGIWVIKAVPFTGFDEEEIKKREQWLQDQKNEQKRRNEELTKQSDLAKLAELKRKYPNA